MSKIWRCHFFWPYFSRPRRPLHSVVVSGELQQLFDHGEDILDALSYFLEHLFVFVFLFFRFGKQSFHGVIAGDKRRFQIVRDCLEQQFFLSGQANLVCNVAQEQDKPL